MRVYQRLPGANHVLWPVTTLENGGEGGIVAPLHFRRVGGYIVDSRKRVFKFPINSWMRDTDLKEIGDRK